MNNKPYFLRPCLVLGTGFHRWVLGESMREEYKPLLDWNGLLLAVARELRVPLDRTEHSLSLHWEQLLATARNEKGFDRSADGRSGAPAVSDLEYSAKKKAAEILANQAVTYPADSSRAGFPLKHFWGAVVSLNFDAHWLSGSPLSWKPLPKEAVNSRPVAGDGRSLRPELLRLNNYVTLPRNDSITRRLWFPNGYVGRPRSMRLGLREFGFQPVAIHEAFNAVKAFESKNGNFEKCKGGIQAMLEGAPTLNSFFDGAPLPLTWVTEMLYRPVCFAGAGMSESESGLWWLMVQRARNLARIRPEHRPPAAILVKHDDPRLPFWRTKPCGIEPIICSNWDEGWEQVAAWGARVLLQSDPPNPYG